jgi:GNAT superfamily N-acetyltransferase
MKVELVTYTPTSFLSDSTVLPPIVDLINTAYNKYKRFAVPRVSGPGQLGDEFSVHGSYFFMLYLHSDVDGHIPITTAGLKPTSTATCKLEVLCTLPSFGQRGYASHMLRHVETTAQAHGYISITLLVVKEHPGVVSFYEKRGYTVVGEESWPDENGGWGHAESWGPVASFTLCTLAKRLG